MHSVKTLYNGSVVFPFRWEAVAARNITILLKQGARTQCQSGGGGVADDMPA